MNTRLISYPASRTLGKRTDPLENPVLAASPHYSLLSDKRIDTHEKAGFFYTLMKNFPSVLV